METSSFSSSETSYGAAAAEGAFGFSDSERQRAEEHARLHELHERRKAESRVRRTAAELAQALENAQAADRAAEAEMEAAREALFAAGRVWTEARQQQGPSGEELGAFAQFKQCLLTFATTIAQRAQALETVAQAATRRASFLEQRAHETAQHAADVEHETEERAHSVSQAIRAMSEEGEEVVIDGQERSEAHAAALALESVLSQAHALAKEAAACEEEAKQVSHEAEEALTWAHEMTAKARATLQQLAQRLGPQAGRANDGDGGSAQKQAGSSQGMQGGGEAGGAGLGAQAARVVALMEQDLRETDPSRPSAMLTGWEALQQARDKEQEQEEEESLLEDQQPAPAASTQPSCIPASGLPGSGSGSGAEAEKKVVDWPAVQEGSDCSPSALTDPALLHEQGQQEPARSERAPSGGDPIPQPEEQEQEEQGQRHRPRPSDPLADAVADPAADRLADWPDRTKDPVGDPGGRGQVPCMSSAALQVVTHTRILFGMVTMTSVLTSMLLQPPATATPLQYNQSHAQPQPSHHRHPFHRPGPRALQRGGPPGP